MAEKEKRQEENFEQNLARLDEILAMLEKDSVPLNDLLSLYEEGVSLVRRCNEQLENAGKKVKMLQISPDGTRAKLVDYEDETSDDR